MSNYVFLKLARAAFLGLGLIGLIGGGIFTALGLIQLSQPYSVASFGSPDQWRALGINQTTQGLTILFVGLVLAALSDFIALAVEGVMRLRILAPIESKKAEPKAPPLAVQTPVNQENLV